MTQPAKRPDPAGKTEDVLEADIERLLTENAALKELIGAPVRPRQQQQWQATLERWAEGAGARAGIASCIKLEITPPSNSNHSRYGTPRAVVVG